MSKNSSTPQLKSSSEDEPKEYISDRSQGRETSEITASSAPTHTKSPPFNRSKQSFSNHGSVDATPIHIENLQNGREMWQSEGRDFYVHHQRQRKAWEKPAEACSPPRLPPLKQIRAKSQSDEVDLAEDPRRALQNTLVTPAVQEPTPKPSASLSRSHTPPLTRTPVKKDEQPSSQVRVVINKSPAISYGSHQDIGRKKRPTEFRESISAKRLKYDYSLPPSSVVHRDLHRFYVYDEDDNRRKQVGQSKVKSVDRSKILLDFGTPRLSSNKRLDLHSLIPPNMQVQQIQKTQFANIFGPPLTFCNEANGKHLNENFRFISSFKKRLGVLEGSPDGDIVCECHGNCTSMTCACVIEGGQSYRVRDDGIVVLRDEFIKPPRSAIKMEEQPLFNEAGTNDDQDERPPVIYECNPRCLCGPECKNRVVQRGRSLPLEIFMTQMCGFGEFNQFSH